MPENNGVLLPESSIGAVCPGEESQAPEGREDDVGMMVCDFRFIHDGDELKFIELSSGDELK